MPTEQLDGERQPYARDETVQRRFGAAGSPQSPFGRHWRYSLVPQVWSLYLQDAPFAKKRVPRSAADHRAMQRLEALARWTPPPLRPHCTFASPKKPPTTVPLLSITIIFFLTIGVLRPPIIIFVLKELVLNMAANALQMSFVMMLMLMIAFLPNLVTTPFYLAESFSMAPYLGL